ncbi:hypothetical protein [Micromonospora avicenniae]|uniref:Uncharacterized protein n=1 Tax=Micromonospora avicenniae TaxID=1198245 RepID=A0A1N6YF03_9ACTN|nr:hypothetical protein [Micromonospora avicenniae]SIR13202.1 hypothetical protein SAMN05444858_106282 [Micromonospora avicenniae]
MDPETELAWLRERVKGLESSLLLARRELFDARSRLAIVARVVEDLDRVKRAPGVAFGAVRAAIHNRTENLRPPNRGRVYGRPR